ncbi:MAG: RluA family pseudouridine synthase [Pirellulales bacterium]
MLDVLYEDNHLLIVNKPAQLPTMGVAEDVPSLLTVAKDYIRRKYHKPGNVYLGVVSRLDAPVTGVVLLARTSKAAGRLSEQFRERDVEKLYWALVCGHVSPADGQLVNYVRKDERHRRMHIVNEMGRDSQRAELSYQVVATEDNAARSQLHPRPDAASPSLSRRIGPLSLLEVSLHTGRKHQIRIQLSHAGHPIVGDRKYGSLVPFSPGIALHSRRLVVEHPVTKRSLAIEAPLPASWHRLCTLR